MTSISFCIVTSGRDDRQLQTCIDSIVALNIPKYEIVFVGGDTTTIQETDIVRWIPFNESIRAHIIVAGKPGIPINMKKNLAVRNAKNDICVVIHDYLTFDPDWWVEFEKFGTDWDLCVHQNILKNGARGDGWRIDRHPLLPRGCMVPYDMIDFAQYMAIAGNYYCIKREKFLAEPLNEDLLWGQADEMEWSRRIVPKSHIQCNPRCIYRYMKDKPDDMRHLTVDMPQMQAYDRVFAAFRECRIENFVMYYEPGFNNNERTIYL